MRRHRPIAASALGALALVAFAACGDKVTIIECPLGTVAQGSQCVPVGPPPADTTPPTPDVTGDTGTQDLPVFPTTDATADETTPPPDVPVGPDTAPELPPDTGPVLGAIGDACQKNGDCADGTCLNWPGGYCTRLDCDVAGCPDGTVCIPQAGGNHACLRACGADGDCRAGGQQACKRIPAGGAELVDVCHGVAPPGEPIGAPCKADVICGGAAVCLASFPGGYCGVLGCDATSCPAGSACVTFGGEPTCLQGCGTDEDCGGTDGAERRCSVLKAVDKAKVGVCISGAEGQPIGAACVNDFECASGTCQVLGEGRCSQSQLPCFANTEDEDCSPVEFCLVTGQNQVGICTQPCGIGTPCPGTSFCVGQPGLGDGWCRVTCGGLGAGDDCPTDIGFACTYGYALGDSFGQGRYLCKLKQDGDVGAPCEGAQDCPGGACDDGRCVRACGDDLFCPFPGLCVATESPPTCRQACLSLVDCGGTGTCSKPQGALGNVCQ